MSAMFRKHYRPLSYVSYLTSVNLDVRPLLELFERCTMLEKCIQVLQIQSLETSSISCQKAAGVLLMSIYEDHGEYSSS